MTVVLDASAVLAVMLEEKGKDKVIPHLTDSLISAINIAEIVSCLTRREIPIQMIEKALRQTSYHRSAVHLRSRTKSWSSHQGHEDAWPLTC